MMRSCRAVALVALVTSPVGCLGVRQAELLEAQLRQQEDALYAIRSEMRAKDAELAAARRELDLLHTERAQAGQAALPAEHVAVVTRATGIRFHSLLTRPLERDDRPGHDALNVVLTPHDAEGEAVKLPGGIRLELLDLSQADGERIVFAWNFTPEEVREHWRSGFIATGYRFELPWPETVAAPNLLLLGRMTTHDGRHFETTQPIVVPRPDQPPRMVERPARTDGASEPVGPARIQEPGASPAETNAESADLDLPTFELPAVDAAHQKASDEPPLEPGPMPIANDEPVTVAGAASPFAPEEPPTQIETVGATALETPFTLSRTEVDEAPLAAPVPGGRVGTREVSAAFAQPAPEIWPRLGLDRPSIPAQPQTLPELERNNRKPTASPGGIAPLHRLGSSLFGGGRSRSFYRSGAATSDGPPTVSLSPAETGQRKPDAQPGTARVSIP